MSAHFFPAGLPSGRANGQAVRVVVREWDPAKASHEQIESLVAALNEVLAADLPGDPPWQTTGMREYLTELMPGERRICWLASDSADGSGPPLGHASLQL